MRVQDEEVTFNVLKSVKFEDDNPKECLRVDTKEGTTEGKAEEQSLNSPPKEACEDIGGVKEEQKEIENNFNPSPIVNAFG